jgi:hypothetical protein
VLACPLKLITAPETAFEVAAGALLEAVVGTVAFVFVPLVVVAEAFAVIVERGVLVGVIILPQGKVDVNPVAASAETPVELKHSEFTGAASPGTNVIAAH